MWYDQITKEELDQEIELVLAEMAENRKKLEAMTEKERADYFDSFPEMPEDFESNEEIQELIALSERDEPQKKSYTWEEVDLSSVKLIALYRLKNRVASR
jgi:signal transduction protein with GAF and PtsI domain